MTENENQTSWEGDIYRDMVTYRFIELSISAIATAFEQEKDLFEKYALWLSEKKADPEAKPIILYSFSPEEESDVSIFAMPNENEFFIRFKASAFECSVSASYDIDRMDVRAARIVMFSGDMLYAVSWAEALHATWDDMLVSLLQQEGGSL